MIRLLVGVMLSNLKPYRWAATVAVVPLLTSYAAGAQQPATPSPVMQHYRAYRAALDQGNLQAAETEAASALAASVEQHGDGGHTGVLAVNLAGVRLTLNENAAAVEPARRALTIAETQGAASGVNTTTARLLLGRAELPDGGVAAQDRLTQAIVAARDGADIEGEAYPATVELGATAYASGRYALARDAWATSRLFVGGSQVNRAYALAVADIGEAMARFRLQEKRPVRVSTGALLGSTSGSTQTVGAKLTPAQEYAQIDAMFTEALDLLHDQAMADERGGALTLAQGMYAQAMAWKCVLLAKLQSERRLEFKVLQPKHSRTEVAATGAQSQECKRRLVAVPLPRYPTEVRVEDGELAEHVDDGVGVVVLKLLSDETGKVVRVQVAASVGGQAYLDSVNAVVGQWFFAAEDPTDAACRLPREVFTAIPFHYR